MCFKESKHLRNRTCSQNLFATEHEPDSNVVFKKMFTSSEAAELLSLSKPLGPDPYVDTRTKSIRYVMLGTDGRFRKLSQDYFVQPRIYNDNPKLGGNKRQYKLLPDNCIDSKLMQKVLHQYKDHKLICPGTVLLIQIQETRAPTRVDCITEQGIHTDGTDDALIACLERSNGKGAANEFYEDVNGHHRLTMPTVLEAGDSVLWKDNAIYHNVTPFSSANPNAGPAFRSILLINSDASFLLDGVPNENNKLISRS